MAETEIDTDRETQIRDDERQRTANSIAHELATKVCSELCEHPSCSTYRFAARTARKHGAPHIPTQPGSDR